MAWRFKGGENMRTGLITTTTVLLFLLLGVPAYADDLGGEEDTVRSSTNGGTVKVTYDNRNNERRVHKAHTSRVSSPTNPSMGIASSSAVPSSAASAVEEPYVIRLPAALYWKCRAKDTAVRIVSLCGPPPLPTKKSAAGKPASTAAAATPTIDVVAIAQRAAAELRLPPSVPHVGPDPALNKWNMSVVGYPLWLWTTDPAHLSTSTTHDGVTVALTATRGATTFTMGDGHRVTCSTMPAWTPAVRQATGSPTCGYRYQKASLPHGPYTITATTTWTVAWSAAEHTGTLPATQQATTRLRVGELQSVVVGP